MAEVILNRPNWLGSEVGLTLKTIMLDTDFATYTEEADVDGNIRKIVKSGTIYSGDDYNGLIYGDIDITNESQIASVMIGGRYIDGNLPATAAGSTDTFEAQGLFAILEGAVTRPDFGTSELEQLDAPVLTDVAGSNKVTFVAIDNAVGYAVYLNGVFTENLEDDDVEYVYGADFSGTVALYALADNVYYLKSDSSNVIDASLTALTAPTLTDVSVSTKVTWAAITGATAYELYLTDVLTATFANSVLEYVYGSFTGTIKLKAIADGTTKADSVMSNTVTIS